MSMNLSEFIRQLGTDPDSRDPEFLRVRHSAPEFIQAADESAQFERKLARALAVPVPVNVLADLKQTAQTKKVGATRWRYYAMAAGLLLVITAAGITWRLNAPEFDSVEQYVAYHYHHDGEDVLARADGQRANNIEEVLSGFKVKLAPGLAGMVSMIKFCPTPAGMGAHLVVMTASGPVTIIFMPDTPVADGEMLAFDGMQAQLVGLGRGSAAVIGTSSQNVAELHSLVQSSFVSLGSEA